MAEAKRCTRCGAYLEPGATACASCGRLATTQTSSCVEVAAAAIAGLVLGSAFGLLLTFTNLKVGNGCSFHGTNAPHPAFSVSLGAVLGVAGVLAAVGLFVYGIRLVQSNRPGVGTSLMVGGAAFLLPATPCAFIAIATGQC